jgi:hypothetical protein
LLDVRGAREVVRVHLVWVSTTRWRLLPGCLARDVGSDKARIAPKCPVTITAPLDWVIDFPKQSYASCAEQEARQEADQIPSDARIGYPRITLLLPDPAR